MMNFLFGHYLEQEFPYLNSLSRASEIAHQGKNLLPSLADDIGSIPGVHMVERIDSLKLSSDHCTCNLHT